MDGGSARESAFVTGAVCKPGGEFVGEGEKVRRGEGARVRRSVCVCSERVRACEI